MPIIGAMMTASEPLNPVYREYAEHFEKLLRMSTFPLAVKMAKRDEDIPKLAKRPTRDFGCHLNTCQCFALSRRSGEMIAQKQEDMWCFEPAVAFGFTGGDTKAFEDGLKFFLDGKTVYPAGAKDLATASKWANSLPRFEPNQYVAVISAPLMKAGFEPDLVLLYVNPAQLNQLLSGVVYEWGEYVTCNIGPHGGCIHYVIPPIKNKNFWISNPCFGDCSFAANPYEELVFSAPMEKVEKLLAAMVRRASEGRGLPLKYQMEPQGWLPDAYSEIARIMKMHRASG